MAEHFDVVVVGAGISGVGQAYHLQKRCPDRSYVILEGRAALGGTWDLFRYPGIRLSASETDVAQGAELEPNHQSAYDNDTYTKMANNMRMSNRGGRDNA